MNFKYILPNLTARAHCDIPCGIYDPTAAKVAAMTVLRMVNQLSEIEPPIGDDAEDAHALNHYHNDIVRRIQTKENHAQICKNELLILWTDYFKPEHLEKYPDLHDQFWTATKLASQNKQDVSEDKAKQLVEAVDEIAQIFYTIKNDPKRYDAYKEITNKLF
ncbi:MAG: superoxide dismutase, Ni [Candidatus Harrisonbacteria bacterium CG10_big_fil_rev_8_21_14_0_10_49_15]|uniref:Superoxide dismutase, Ni n=1 Tax=Candidatus Harrisonbacteria bacterium CG10_big_fil_rev_8_21_14_0_10_49_15 TaxID=1974587 RepID=A0A2H0UM16_9BACT|nr:MAG: superoxide dismutase, Ni [Candidatus Harrisonbacteria bacterium CG10_big_fil_rev_8_21_14_0_10_49_15]